MAHVVIITGGYAPTCSDCGSALVEGDDECPECGAEINWDDKR